MKRVNLTVDNGMFLFMIGTDRDGFSPRQSAASNIYNVYLRVM